MCTIAANQAGSVNYEPAPQVTFQIRIGDPVNQSITFGPAPTVMVGSVGTLNATASSGLPVSFASNTPSICTVSGNTVTGVALGSCTVAADQPGDAQYAAAPEVTQTFPVTANGGTFVLTVSKSGAGTGAVASSPGGIACGSTCAANFASGTVVTLTATPASDSVFAGWSGPCSGTGTCSVTMDAAKTVAASFVLATSVPRLVGLSTRARVFTGDNVMIGGFIIGGATPKTVVIRARGPSLGVGDALANPTLTLVPASGAPTITNDDWQSAGNAAQLSASGFEPGDSRESAILATLDPGAYTAIVSGVGNTTGVALVEVFEMDHPEAPLTAISTRGFVQTGDNVMIGGFIIQGSSPRTVVVRARGPSLGVAGALQNPVLTLVPADGSPTTTNDDWQSAGNAAQLAASGFQPGDPRESAILVTLNPGAYTAVVSGVGGTMGIAIVEVYAQ
jgi:hypothetical protein